METFPKEMKELVPYSGALSDKIPSSQEKKNFMMMLYCQWKDGP